MPPKQAQPRRTELEKFRDNLLKQFGGDKVVITPEENRVCSTGSLTLDYALRRGGWDEGRIHEIVGAPDMGKSTLCLATMSAHQRAHPDEAVAYIDIEGTFDYKWAAKNGLDTSPALFQHLYPESSEDASDMARFCAQSGLFSCAVVDSIGGMESKKAYEDKPGEIRDAEKELPGRNAQVITRMVKHLSSLARTSGMTVILVNQYRVVIGGFGGQKPAGPSALQHATSTRVEMRRTSVPPVKVKVGGGEEEIASVQVRARVARSKLVAPGGIAEFWINNRDTEQYGPAGLNIADEYAEVGIAMRVIEQAGAWYQLPGGPKVQGRPAVVTLLRSEPELMKTVREKVLSLSALSLRG